MEQPIGTFDEYSASDSDSSSEKESSELSSKKLNYSNYQIGQTYSLEDDHKVQAPTNLFSKLAKKPEFNSFNSKSHRLFSFLDFEIGTYLGGGRFGKVYLAREKSSGFLVAIKRISKKETLRSNNERQLAEEITIQSNLNHPNVLKLYTYFHDEKFVNLVLEWCFHGELFKEIQLNPKKRIDETQAAFYIYQMISALAYCQAKNIIHRDIKPENILNSFVVF